MLGASNISKQFTDAKATRKTMVKMTPERHPKV